MSLNERLYDCVGFEWDFGNFNKNWYKHGVPFFETEQIFSNQPLILFEDAQHSDLEDRYYAFGKTDFGRLLFVAFTVRNKLIRVISARDMNKKERRKYYEAQKENP